MPRTYAKLQYFAYLAKTSKFKRSFFSKLASVLTILLQLKHHFRSMAISSHSLSSKMVISNHLLRISDLRRTFLPKRNLQLKVSRVVLPWYAPPDTSLPYPRLTPQRIFPLERNRDVGDFFN